MLKVGWSPSTRFPGHGSLGPGLRALAHCETHHHDVPWPSWLVQNFVVGKCARTMQRLTMVKLGHFPMGISMSWWWFKPMGISMFWCWNVEELLYEEWSLQHVVAPGSTPGLSRIDWIDLPKYGIQWFHPNYSAKYVILRWWSFKDPNFSFSGLTSSMNTFPQTSGSTTCYEK